MKYLLVAMAVGAAALAGGSAQRGRQGQRATENADRHQRAAQAPSSWPPPSSLAPATPRPLSSALLSQLRLLPAPPRLLRRRTVRLLWRRWPRRDVRLRRQPLVRQCTKARRDAGLYLSSQNEPGRLQSARKRRFDRAHVAAAIDGFAGKQHRSVRASQDRLRLARPRRRPGISTAGKGIMRPVRPAVAATSSRAISSRGSLKMAASELIPASISPCGSSLASSSRSRAAKPAGEHGLLVRVPRPPHRDRLVRQQEGHVREVFLPFAPPWPREPQQDLDDAAEADVVGDRGLRTCICRKRDFAQQRQRNGEDHTIAAMHFAAGATDAIAPPPLRSPTPRGRSETSRQAGGTQPPGSRAAHHSRRRSAPVRAGPPSIHSSRNASVEARSGSAAS